MKLTAKGEALCFTDPSGATWGSGGSHTLDTRAVSQKVSSLYRSHWRSEDGWESGMWALEFYIWTELGGDRLIKAPAGKMPSS